MSAPQPNSRQIPAPDRPAGCCSAGSSPPHPRAGTSGTTPREAHVAQHPHPHPRTRSSSLPPHPDRTVEHKARHSAGRRCCSCWQHAVKIVHRGHNRIMVVSVKPSSVWCPVVHRRCAAARAVEVASWLPQPVHTVHRAVCSSPNRHVANTRSRPTRRLLLRRIVVPPPSRRQIRHNSTRGTRRSTPPPPSANAVFVASPPPWPHCRAQG